MAYRVQIADLDGTLLDEVPAKNLQYTFALNEPGSVGFTLPRRDAKTLRSTLEPGQREVWVLNNHTKVWGGYLWGATLGGEDDKNIVRFAGMGYLSRFDRRYIKKNQTFTDVEQFTIAWTLINDSQSLSGGGLGITQASVPASGRTRTRQYYEWERKNLGEALRELAQVENGFDFEITADKEWRTYYPSKGQQTAHVFDLEKNIRGLGYELDALKVATEITAFGVGEGNLMVRSTAADASALGEFGLLQDVIAHKSVREQTTIDDKARDELRLRKVTRTGLEISVAATNDPPLGSYTVGDKARIIADIGYEQVDKNMRITAIVVQITDEGTEVPTVFFEEVA